MIDKATACDVLTAALSTGGDFAEIFAEHNVRNRLEIVNGITESVSSRIIYGAGIRLFIGTSAIYAYTNDLTRENLIAVAKAVAATLDKNAKTPVERFLNFEYESAHKYIIMPADFEKKAIIERLRLASDYSKKASTSIKQTNSSYQDSVQDVLIANSDGLWAEDRRVRNRTVVTAVASNETEKQTATSTKGALAGIEYFNSVDFAAFGDEVGKRAATMLSAKYAPSGKMPVVIDNGFGGVILHEACVHALEATSVATGASVFCGKLGSRIASPVVTAVDDGTMPNEWGSMNIDDEGTKTRRNVLIENGILKSYLVDRRNGLKMGMKPTGSSRRESYKYAPTSRMTNTFIVNGNDKPQDIISETEYGLYAKTMGGGSVNPSTGEFNFSVSEAYMIRGGKIAEPVRGASLIGKGEQVLLNIDRVADNFAQETGLCGSVSGKVQTNVGQPMIRVKELTVGGRD